MSNRDADLAQLNRDIKSATGRDKREIQKAAYKIQNESGAVRSMRDALIKEHKQGRVENVKDIHDYMKKKSKYA